MNGKPIARARARKSTNLCEILDEGFEVDDDDRLQGVELNGAGFDFLFELWALFGLGLGLGLPPLPLPSGAVRLPLPRPAQRHLGSDVGNGVGKPSRNCH